MLVGHFSEKPKVKEIRPSKQDEQTLQKEVSRAISKAPTPCNRLNMNFSDKIAER